MTVPGLLGVVLAYSAFIVLLLSLNFLSLWRWWIKAGAVVLGTVAMFGTYAAVRNMLGWPAITDPPSRFQVLATRLVEPNKFEGTEGALFIWLEELDDDNVPLGMPRAYRLPYEDATARRVEEVQERLDAGEEIMGVVDEDDADPIRSEKIRVGETSDNPELSAAMDTVPFTSDGLTIEFEQLPPIMLPVKSPL